MFPCRPIEQKERETMPRKTLTHLAAPALIALGLDPLLAHLFVFLFALISTLTPPVCGVVFIAAGMANENWLKVALTAMALGIGLYIIPLAMIANPEIIRLATEPVGALLYTVKIAAGLLPISFGVLGRVNVVMRLGLIALGLGIIFLI